MQRCCADHLVRRTPLLNIDASNWTDEAKTTTSMPERPLPADFG